MTTVYILGIIAGVAIGYILVCLIGDLLLWLKEPRPTLDPRDPEDKKIIDRINEQLHREGVDPGSVWMFGDEE